MPNNKKQKNILINWRAVKLSDIGVFSKGSGISKSQLTRIGHNAVRYGEIYTKYNFQIKKIYSFIPDGIILQSKKIKYGDILFAGSGETINEIGKSATYLFKEDCYAGGDIIIFSPKNANSLFLSYLLNIGEVRRELRRLGQGQSVVHIYKKDIENIVIYLPKLSEQNRIVAVFEVWDGVIEKLEKKIEIKKNIKKGLMQRLLSGKLRLPGFKDEWRIVKLGEICQIERGDMITSKELVAGDIPVIAGGKQPAYYHNKSNYSGKTITVSGSGASAGYVNYFNAPIFASDCSVIKNREDQSVIDYIYYVLHNKQSYIYSLQSGGAQPHVYPKDLARIKINIPNLKEQSAISNIIISSDVEIKILEKKLKIIKEQKRYLLNNLITGAIRVPETIKIN